MLALFLGNFSSVYAPFGSARSTPSAVVGSIPGVYLPGQLRQTLKKKRWLAKKPFHVGFLVFCVQKLFYLNRR